MRNASTTSRWVRRSAGAVGLLVVAGLHPAPAPAGELAHGGRRCGPSPSRPRRRAARTGRAARRPAARPGTACRGRPAARVPTWSARTASCTGSASDIGRSVSASCSGSASSRRLPAAAQLVEADPRDDRGQPGGEVLAPRTRRCARAAATPPARRRPPRAPSRASGRPPRAGGCAGPRTQPRAAPGPRGPSWSPCPFDVRRGSDVTRTRLRGLHGPALTSTGMTPAELLIDAFERIQQDRHRRGRRPHRRPARRPPGARGELDRLAGLAPGPGPGRPRRRCGGHRAGVDRAGLRDPLRPAVRLRRDRLRHEQRGGRPRAGRCRAARPTTSTRCTRRPSPTSRPSRPRTSTGSSTSAGTRRSRSACGWSACSATTSSTPARRRTAVAGGWSPSDR